MTDLNYSRILPVIAFASLATLMTILGMAPTFGQTVSDVTIVTGAGASASADCVSANNCFSPSVLNVAPGTTVTWTNTDKLSHTITSGKVSDDNAGSLFDSGLVKSGNTFQFTFSTAGTYNYYCTVHPWMIGQVVVGGATGPTNPNANVTTPTIENLPIISIKTDLPSYNQGDMIVTTGHITNLQGSTAVTYKIFNPYQNLLAVRQLVPNSDGSFTSTFLATGPLWANAGTYTIQVLYGQATPATATFYFNGGTGTSGNVPGNFIGGKIGYKAQASDGTTVLVITAAPISAQPLVLGIGFKDSTGNFVKHQNYAMTVTQDNSIVLSVPNGHTHTGTDTQTTQSLLSADQISIQITLNGVGLPTADPSTWTGVKGETLSFSQVTGPINPNANVTTSYQNPQSDNSLEELLKQRYDAAKKLQEMLNAQAGVNIAISQGAGASASADCVTANTCFSPNPLTVAPGTTVTWTNIDTVSHTITSGKVSDNNAGSLFDSGLVKQGKTFQFTFATSGTFNYFCTVHPWMVGQVIVGMGGHHEQENGDQQRQHEREQNNYGIINPTQQDIQNINQAKTNQTIAAEINFGANQSQTTSIDNNVSVQTTQNTPDSLGVQVSATNQTGPKVIVFNLNATTINLQNLKDLGVMYDGKFIQPAPNMDAILHAKSTDNPSFAIVVTQSGIQVLVLVPHFSTHTITITNMSKVMTTTIPEFGQIATMIFAIAIVSIIVVSAKTGLRFLPKMS